MIGRDTPAAIVTGAAGQIGRAVVTNLLNSGMNICAADVVAPDPRELWKPFADGRVHPVSADVGDPESIRNLVAQATDDFGRIDVLVNVAGVVSFGSAAELALDEWNRVIDINLRGTFLCCQAVIPIMQRQRRGRIVNIGSVVAKNGGNARAWRYPEEQARAANIAYGVSKAGVHAMTFFLAKELASYGITVNCVAPGPVRSPLTRDFPQHLLDPIPIGRMADADEIAEAVAFLVGAGAKAVTGEVLDVNGGLWCD